MRTVPTLETERLVLRGHAVSDFAQCLALWSDPEVVRYIGGKPSTPEMVWARLLRYAGHWLLLGYGFWVIVERQSGRFVGEVGLADFHRQIEPPIGDTPEMGWVLQPWSQGQGFATEAVQAVLGWAEGQLGTPRTVCVIEPANRASLRVAAKSGFVPYAQTQYEGGPIVLLERTR